MTPWSNLAINCIWVFLDIMNKRGYYTSSMNKLLLCFVTDIEFVFVFCATCMAINYITVL